MHSLHIVISLRKQKKIICNWNVENWIPEDLIDGQRNKKKKRYIKMSFLKEQLLSYLNLFNFKN